MSNQVQAFQPNKTDFLALATKYVKDIRTGVVPENATISMELPKTGLARTLRIMIDGNIKIVPSGANTSGTITGGRWRGYANFAPYGLIKNIRLGPSSQFELVNLPGAALYLINRVSKAYDSTARSTDTYSGASSFARGGFAFPGKTNPSGDVIIPRQGTPGGNAILDINAGQSPFNFGLSGITIPVKFMLEIPLAYDGENTTGLINLQQAGQTYTLSMDIGNVIAGIAATGGSNDIFDAITGTNIAVQFNANYTVSMEYYMVPVQLPNGRPVDYSKQTDYYVQRLMRDYTYQVGENTLELPTVEQVSVIVAQMTNNGGPLNMTNDFTNYSVRMRNGLAKFEESYPSMAHRYYQEAGTDLPDGCIVVDASRPRGNPHSRELLDLLPATEVNEMELRFAVPTTATLVNPTARLITECIRKVV